MKKRLLKKGMAWLLLTLMLAPAGAMLFSNAREAAGGMDAAAPVSASPDFPVPGRNRGGRDGGPPAPERNEPRFSEDRVLVKLAAGGSPASPSPESSAPSLGVGFSEMRLLNPSTGPSNETGGGADDTQNNVYVLTLEQTGPGAVERALEVLNASPLVEIAEPDYLYELYATPNDPQYNAQWALQAMNAQQAWDVTRGSKDVVVGIIDTGIDGTHPDLVENLWINPNPNQNGYKNDIHGYNFTGRTGGIPTDENGHGTHVAGIVGAKGNNGIGVCGVNWDVSLAWLGVSTGGGYLSISACIEALNYANNHNIPITNNSYGGYDYSQIFEEEIGNYRGLFVAAAGNDRNNNDSYPAYPASYDLPNVLSVASTASPGSLSGFSNYGENSVHIAAPGSGIVNTYPGGTYRSLSGTSMASPQVAGVAALVLAANPGYSTGQIKKAILDGAEIQSSLMDYVNIGRELNAYHALVPWIAPDSITITPGSLALDVTGISKLSASLLPAATPQVVLWESSDPEKVLVNADGTVIALQAGQATVTARAPKLPEISASVTVTVTNSGTNAVLFKDIIFKQAVIDALKGIDSALYAGHTIYSSIYPQDVQKITSLNVSGRWIRDMEGIQHFTALTALRCGGNLLKSLDLSKNTELTYLSCGDNPLQRLDVSGCAKLGFLFVNGAELTELDLSRNSALTALQCGWNRLTRLDVSSCTELKILVCDSNRLTSLDISGCTALEEILCWGNPLRYALANINGHEIRLRVESYGYLSFDYYEGTVYVVTGKTNFVCWTDAGVRTDRPNYFEFVPDRDYDLTAHFREFYTVFFDGNGGSKVYPEFPARSSGLVREPAPPTFAGCVFTGWRWYQGNGTPWWNFSKDKASSDMTLVATWLPNINPVITTAGLPDGAAGTAYSQTLTAVDSSPITWSLADGSLPDGLALNQATGVISGTPGVVGKFDFTVKAQTYAGSDSKQLSIRVAPPITAPVITTASLPDGMGENFYAQSLSATGSTPLTWSVTAGELPGGLALNQATGAIYGWAKNVAGTFNFTVTAKNSAGSDSKNFSIKITPYPVKPVIVPKILPAGREGTAYSQKLEATSNVPVAWSVAAGSLPDGLALGPTTGTIFGTPGTAGKFDFTVKAQNAAGSDTKAFSITIARAPVPPTITTASLPGGRAGTYYAQRFTATGDASIRWSVTAGALPDGLQMFSPYSGEIDGTPSKEGTFRFTVTAQNDAGSDSREYTVTIAPAPIAPIITTAGLPDGMAGAAYSQTLEATGEAPINWKSDLLPDGLTLDPNTGTIAGTPTAPGTFDFYVRAGNIAGIDLKQFSITIVPPLTPVITTESLPAGALGTYYSQALAATGEAPIAWSVAGGALPDGLALSGETISGIPGAAGAFDFTLKAQNARGSDTRQFSVTIEPAFVPVAGVTLNTYDQILRVGETYQLIATASPAYATNKAVAWSSSAPAIASVDANGVVTARAEGYAIITVTAQENGLSAQCAVTSKRPGFSFHSKTATLGYRSSAQLPFAENDGGLRWSSSNPSVQVDQTGRVTSLKGSRNASATITVRDAQGNPMDSCTVKVSTSFFQWVIVILLFGWIWY